MSDTRSKPHVLIVGGGLGGLALAQSLRKKEISFDLFERDASDDARFQGWAISLHPWFKNALLAATRDDMPNIETVGTTYEIGIPSEGAIFNAYDLTERMRFGRGHNGGHFIRADRAKLRRWLLTDLDVHWAKKFSHYEQDDQGVTAFFDDGSSYRGDVLVGADGINSLVGHQLFPNATDGPKHVPQGIIVGEVTATYDQLQRWMKIATSFFIGYAGPRRIFVGQKGINPDGKSAQYYWMFGWADKAAESESFWTRDASQEQLHSFIMNTQVEGVHPTFAEIIRATPVEGILHPPLRLRDMVPPELPRGRVTLLGDSVHPMVPFRGEGGNMAMADGFSLANAIDAGRGNPVEDVLKNYESEMIPRTTKSVLASRAADDPTKQS